MSNLYIGWVGAAVILAFVSVLLGIAIHDGPLGVLIDSRGRYSLTHLQLVLWTFVVIPLIAGVFWGRLFSGQPQTALSFTIPNYLLLVLGISVASAAASTATKAYKDSTGADIPHSVPGAQDKSIRPFFAQVFMLEEGPMANRVVDVTKFQNFWFTLILVAAYLALAIGTFSGASSPAKIDALPDFTPAMATILALSHAGYLAGKLPQRSPAPS